MAVSVADLRAARPKADLRVVTPPRGSALRGANRARRLLITMCTFITVVLAFGVVASQVVLTQNQDRLDKLNRRVEAAEQRYDRLRFQVAELESPERIVAAAHNRLGMVDPVNVTYVAPVAATPSTDAAPAVTAAPDWRLVKAELAKK